MSGEGDNEDLSIKDLRTKCIALLSLALMLRPSDIAPHGVHYDSQTHTTRAMVFSTDCLDFQSNGALSVTLFGTKTDSDRAGFLVLLPPHTVAKLDPVAALACYIRRTARDRCVLRKPLFLSLVRPFKALSAAQVSSVLNDAIVAAGLAGLGFSAKYFRPTGATHAVSTGVDPEIIRKMGRWKTSQVFYDHYVHTVTPQLNTTATIGAV